MPLILSVLPVLGTNQFEALIVKVPEGVEATTAGETVWSEIFDTEEEARMAGQEELKAESEQSFPRVIPKGIPPADVSRPVQNHLNPKSLS